MGWEQWALIALQSWVLFVAVRQAVHLPRAHAPQWVTGIAWLAAALCVASVGSIAFTGPPLLQKWLAIGVVACLVTTILWAGHEARENVKELRKIDAALRQLTGEQPPPIMFRPRSNRQRWWQRKRQDPDARTWTEDDFA